MKKLYLALAQQYSDQNQTKERGEMTLKAGQFEAAVMAEERALEILLSINLSDTDLYEPVKE